MTRPSSFNVTGSEKLRPPSVERASRISPVMRCASFLVHVTSKVPSGVLAIFGRFSPFASTVSGRAFTRTARSKVLPLSSDELT